MQRGPSPKHFLDQCPQIGIHIINIRKKNNKQIKIKEDMIDLKLHSTGICAQPDFKNTPKAIPLQHMCM